MVTPTCPKCRAVIPADDINVSANVAYCRLCHLAHSLSALAGRGGGINPELDLDRPPVGAWKRSSPLGTIIGASHRSIGSAIGIFLFAAFWNGIVSVFIALALSSTISPLGITLPDWLPTPRMNNSTMTVGMTIFLWLFLTPFIAIGLAMIAAFISCLFGKTEIRLRDWEGEIFSGVGSLGFRRKFKTDAVRDVRIDDDHWHDSKGRQRNKTQVVVELIEEKPIKFASSLPEDRRQFLAANLRAALIK